MTFLLIPEVDILTKMKVSIDSKVVMDRVWFVSVTEDTVDP